jgi:hypothetical protein
LLTFKLYYYENYNFKNYKFLWRKLLLHLIELKSKLNLGNNFQNCHFRAAIEKTKEREELQDYLYNQETSGSFEVTARGNYGTVSSGKLSVYEGE